MAKRTTLPFGDPSTQCGEALPACGDCTVGGGTPPSAGRRLILKAALAAGGGLALPAVLPTTARAADGSDQRRNERPQPGDVFVFVTGDKEGQVVAPADLSVGGPPVMAWPMEPASKTLRDGSRLNQVLLLRLDPASLDETTRSHAADGIVAYSAICTHQQCPVSGWNAEKQALHCPCHESEFDPHRDGTKVFGPAPRSLPALPVKIADGALVAAGTFLHRMGKGAA
jgi:rieske iron-sulfur protein